MVSDVLSSGRQKKVDKQGGKWIAWSVSLEQCKSATAKKECEEMTPKKPSVTEGEPEPVISDCLHWSARGW